MAKPAFTKAKLDLSSPPKLPSEQLSNLRFTFEDALSYLSGLEMFGIKLGLERTERMLAELGKPHFKYKTVHVTGTNGKGSVSAMIAGILAAAGYRVGLYTSPHISDFRERVAVLDESGAHLIDEKSAASITARIRKTAQKLGEQPTYFEAGTVLAFQYFAEREVDFAVVEVGMGGRLDATNVILPEVSVITAISLEHTTHLGDDLRSIAREKGGIIKEGKPLVTGASGEALEALKEMCAGRNAPLIHVGTDVKYAKRGSDSEWHYFDVSGTLDTYDGLATKMYGDYQIFNAAAAIGAIECLKGGGAIIPRQSIYDGIASTVVPGRFEVVAENPQIVLDVAHNPQAAEALAATIRSIKRGKAHLVLGIMKDKDVASIVRALAGVADTIIAAKPRTQRAAEARQIAQEAQSHGVQSIVIEDVRKAFEYAKFIARPDDIVCVAGSFYTVGEVRGLFVKKA